MESSKDLRNDIEIAYNSYASTIKESLKGKTGIFTFKYDRKRKTQTVKNSERRLRTVFDSGKKRQANWVNCKKNIGKQQKTTTTGFV